ncbi:putative pyruvyl transferase EpsO [Spirochaetia bacterium]|nr:putative pyruvyl transferase EpsO [Spirochaetia bacterium]
MTFSEKNNILKNEIINTLRPHITNDYWLLELPYYTNIGDVLIWQGSEDFLKTLNAHCKYKSSSNTFKPQRISLDTIILLQGGGNFGDIWNEPQEFRRKIITSYPDNKIIILPQTVWYNDETLLLQDAQIYAGHKNLILCARDKKSYGILNEYFSANVILLVPDMAFCIDPKSLRKHYGKPSEKSLFLKRTDQELNKGFNYSDFIDEESVDIADWPPMEKRMLSSFLLRCFIWISRRIKFLFPKLTDIYASLIFKPCMVKVGIGFIKKYEKVYTTRLHAGILCCLLEKPFVFFDNSYGKNSSFFETWLSDLEQVEFH